MRINLENDIDAWEASEHGGQAEVVLVARGAHDEEEVDERPDAYATAGEQFADTHAGVADVETVDAETAEEERQQQADHRILELHRGDDVPFLLVGGEQGVAQGGHLFFSEILGIHQHELVHFFHCHGEIRF